MVRTYSKLGSLACLTLFAVSLAGFGGAFGCSSSSPKPGETGDDGGDDGGTGCTAYDPGTQTTAAVSFKSDVLPIFQGSCGISGPTCHGQQGGGQQNLYLAEGKAAGDGLGDPTVILPAIVGVKSQEDPSMNIITAGDPTMSFLMHKMDGDQCQFIPACGASDSGITPPCGVTMPDLNPLLEPSQRDTIRRWITQGAKNN